MEIHFEKKGDLQVLAIKGRFHLQSWRVLDKHLENLLLKDTRWLALDLSEVTLICSTGVGSILYNIRKYQERDCSLMLISTTPYVQDLFQIFGCDVFLGECVFRDWKSLEKRLQSQGLAVTG